jgi:plastocyanin
VIRRAALAIAALLAFGLAPARGARAGEPVTIAIDHFAFGPNDITVEPGTIVEWVNRDQTIHNIIMPAAKVASPGMDTGDHFTFRFETAGDFSYLCGLHPHMTGVVHVKAKTS